jgi:hypothetical protein
MSADSQILLIGLPGTGKTSFLAALWYMVDQATVDCALVLDKLDGDITYLNQIRQSWLDYKAVHRTYSDSEKVVSMRLKHRSNGSAVKLTFPDLSGESFRLQWTERQFTANYDKLLREAHGAILFIHPDTVVKPNRIDMVDELLSGQWEGDEKMAAAPAGSFGRPWESQKAPTQVQLIELLQFIVAQEYFRPPFKLAVVVSAWDMLVGLGNSPKHWVSSQLPMLSQYLESNELTFQPSFYGLSAQGVQYPSWRLVVGDITNERAFAKRLAETADAVSSWLWGQLNDSLQSAVRARINQEADSSELQAQLVNRVNAIISTSTIFDAERFKGVTLRKETRELLELRDVQKGEEMVQVNRALLEDAYPGEFSRDLQLDAAMQAFRHKLPARRVSVVDENNQVSHDITEPVRWLMK